MRAAVAIVREGNWSATVKELAVAGGTSPRNLTRRFHEEMECTITEYIRRQRLEAVNYLLLAGIQKAEISECIRFSHPTALSRFMRQHGARAR